MLVGFQATITHCWLSPPTSSIAPSTLKPLYKESVQNYSVPTHLTASMHEALLVTNRTNRIKLPWT